MDARRAYLGLLKKTLIRLPMTPDDVRLRERVRDVPTAQTTACRLLSNDRLDWRDVAGGLNRRRRCSCV
jgi:hypothetical protein